MQQPSDDRIFPGIYEQLFLEAPDLLTLETPEGTILRANRSFAALFGYADPAHLAGTCIRTLLEQTPDSHQPQTSDSRHCFVQEVRTPSGEIRTYEVSRTCLESPSGPLLLYRGRDISQSAAAQRELERREQLFGDMFRRHSAPMLLIDPHESGAIVDANCAAEQFYGYSRDELLSMRISQINTASPESILKSMNQLRAFGNGHFHFEHRLADGSLRSVEVFSTPIHHADRKLLFSIVHDISERQTSLQHLLDAQERIRELARQESRCEIEREQELEHHFCHDVFHRLAHTLRIQMNHHLDALRLNLGPLAPEPSSPDQLDNLTTLLDSLEHSFATSELLSAHRHEPASIQRIVLGLQNMLLNFPNANPLIIADRPPDVYPACCPLDLLCAIQSCLDFLDMQNSGRTTFLHLHLHHHRSRQQLEIELQIPGGTLDLQLAQLPRELQFVPNGDSPMAFWLARQIVRARLKSETELQRNAYSARLAFRVCLVTPEPAHE